MSATNRNFFSAKTGFIVAITTLVGVIGLTGCAAKGGRIIEDSQNRLLTARVVKEFSDLPATELKANTMQNFKIGSDTSGNSSDLAIALENNELVFAKVFKLPNWEAQYSLKLISKVMGGLNDPAIFYPRYIMLDENFKQTRTSAAGEFVYRGVGEYGAVAATIFVNQANQHEAYIAVVSETRDDIKEHTSVMQSSGSMARPFSAVGIWVWRSNRDFARSLCSRRVMRTSPS